MNGTDKAENLNALARKRKPGAGLFVTAALAAVLAIAYIAHAAEPARLEGEIKVREAKLNDTKKYVAQNYDALIGAKERPGEQAAPKEMPLLTVIKESAERVGLTASLSSVSPEENKKLGLVTAKVVLRRIRLTDLVNFLVHIRSNYPGIMDREGRLRLLPRQQGDSWDVFVSLTVKRN